ncbi:MULTISPECIES: copper chaperone PCu(A)C [Microbulbifer]|uniref:copper chaperone PCu(A)C n=1 Tax=Microbulbifer TaxID=48073 RepID=UPI001E5097D7|nr:copper chaperone PCu(A)C [Microbulbifer sp. YPW16]UHQ54441.1 copper chaperone PCu(A)C [Microbulbifer sp. YPW16]
MKQWLLCCLAMAALSGSPLAAAALDIDGYARETLPGATMSAAYLTLRNGGDTARTLERVELPGVEGARAQIHSTVRDNGVSRMRPLTALPVPATSSVAMAPGGIHLMLSGAELRAGGQVQLRLHFADGEVQLISVPVRGAAGQAHHH